MPYRLAIALFWGAVTLAKAIIVQSFGKCKLFLYLFASFVYNVDIARVKACSGGPGRGGRMDEWKQKLIDFWENIRINNAKGERFQVDLSGWRKESHIPYTGDYHPRLSDLAL